MTVHRKDQEDMGTGHSAGGPDAGGRSEREVLADVRRFAQEDPRTSWWHLTVTFLMLAGLVTLAAITQGWPVRLSFSLLAALVTVRGFILYHDHMHGSLLRRSLAAKIFLHLYGYLLLAPANSWRKSHNFHHAHVGQVEGEHHGTFPIMSSAQWRQAPFAQRLAYRLNRHPLVIILSAYLTVFAWSVTISPLFRQPMKHWDSAIALLVHLGMVAGLWWLGGFAMAFFAFLLPVAVAGMLGAYLFYAQHNFPGMQILSPDEWTNYRASLVTCSYFKLGRIMRWVTGNIGFHHIHHLNLAIPFYRLPEAIEAIPELQQPIVTSFRLRDIIACLRLHLWDEESGQMVGYRAVRLGVQ